ncbi:hypothetical protein METSCH_G01340 [Metschnikowia aff. pulcherrima]|uniref:Secreted protein n=1 Tax=Metschnikowia aff. pulcherrima TaxID=2163413 RepID=A0A4P6XU03_9ASCO|nr:hypothetical protein METSCH_G01340 [Metschnikowia aff. pulcherrima]
MSCTMQGLHVWCGFSFTLQLLAFRVNSNRQPVRRAYTRPLRLHISMHNSGANRCLMMRLHPELFYPPCILTLARLFWIRLFRSLRLYRVISFAYFLANYESVKTSICLSNRSQLNAARQSILLTATGPGDPCYLPLSTDSFTHIHSMTLL